MSKKAGNQEKELASEAFLPSLNDEYTSLFNDLLDKLNQALPTNRVAIIENEIQTINNIVGEDELEKLKYIAVLHVLIDLSQQGWIFVIENNKLTLKMENSNIDDKERIRYRLSAERNAQFKTESVQSFVRMMETPKRFGGAMISVRNLFGDPQHIINSINNNAILCQPYIQMVSDTRDALTGYKLSDIWRYFRYTWSIPYKTMPGRNLYYLVRDAMQPYHPVVGIFALGNSVLNLTVRDNDIGWTVDAIRTNMSRKYAKQCYEQIVSGTDGRTIISEEVRYTESETEYRARAQQYADEIYPLLSKSINLAISDIYVKDLEYDRRTKKPTQDMVDRLNEISERYAALSLNNKNNEKSPVWEDEAKTNLFVRKRSAELAKLLATKITFQSAKGANNYERLKALLSTEDGRRAIHTALIANRKCKIGSNMMDIIVCGSIPPYNELLGGKLISILACSPTVIRDYTNKYAGQVSEIASRMKGKRVIRDSHLVYLGTTSLYAVGSSQYNRIKVPLNNGVLEYRKMGVTEGFGTVYFSKETTSTFSKILELQDGGKKINHVFGEGTSPRFRMISKGLSAIGIRAEAFLKHYSPRIVYSINLASNTNEFLLGLTDSPEYGFDLENEQEVAQRTQDLIDYWYNRWAINRVQNVDLIQRLNDFNINQILLGNI